MPVKYSGCCILYVSIQTAHGNFSAADGFPPAVVVAHDQPEGVVDFLGIGHAFRAAAEDAHRMAQRDAAAAVFRQPGSLVLGQKGCIQPVQFFHQGHGQLGPGYGAP